MVVAANCFNICLADLNKKCVIQQHEIVKPKIGTVKAGSQLTDIYTGWFKIETIKGSRRFSGVNINKSATHLFTTRYRTAIKQLDGVGETFIKRSERLFRVIEVTNLNEDDEWLIFQCTDRGLESKNASHA